MSDQPKIHPLASGLIVAAVSAGILSWIVTGDAVWVAAGLLAALTTAAVEGARLQRD